MDGTTLGPGSPLRGPRAGVQKVDPLCFSGIFRAYQHEEPLPVFAPPDCRIDIEGTGQTGAIPQGGERNPAEQTAKAGPGYREAEKPPGRVCGQARAGAEGVGFHLSPRYVTALDSGRESATHQEVGEARAAEDRRGDSGTRREAGSRK